ncbi:excitatory amino acid transporter 5-like isoform 2-T2 [Cyanocitta cristata]
MWGLFSPIHVPLATLSLPLLSQSHQQRDPLQQRSDRGVLPARLGFSSAAPAGTCQAWSWPRAGLRQQMGLPGEGLQHRPRGWGRISISGGTGLTGPGSEQGPAYGRCPSQAQAFHQSHFLMVLSPALSSPSSFALLSACTAVISCCWLSSPPPDIVPTRSASQDAPYALTTHSNPVSLVSYRNMFPSNLVEASFQQYRTVLVPVVKSPGFQKIPGKPVNFIYFAPDDKNPEIHRPVFLELTPSPEMTYRTLAGTSNEMNVLGIVIFSATIGLLLGKMGERGAPLVNVCQCLNEAVMKIVSMAVWYFPFGIVFLIAGKILEMEDPSIIGQKLGLYVITVVSGLAFHGIILLPLLFVLITKKNPFAFIQGILQALLIALATSSSSATLPITLKCLLENNGIDRRVARFVLPVGATINMDGTALYEAVAAIFIAQVNEYELDLGQIITISITASAASIGAAGIPQSGLVTMVIVLTSVGLPTEDITLIIAVDWALDRLRTMTNVLGDALAAGIIAHVCEKDFAPKPVPVCRAWWRAGGRGTWQDRHKAPAHSRN